MPQAKKQWHFWFSNKQASASWGRLPLALIDGKRWPYTICESKKGESRPHKTEGSIWNDWRYLGKGTMVQGGVLRLY